MAADAASVVGTDVTDAHLVTRAQDGDRSAFEELFRRHAHPAWRLALAVGGHREAAEIAVAEGFTATFRQLRSGTATPAAPFRMLVVRATFDAACVEARRSPGAGGAAGNDAVAAFRRLPERWRAALWLTMVEGGTPAQVAPLLGLSEDATASLSRKASDGLRERLLAAGSTAAAAAADPSDDLRALVIGLPAGLRSGTIERWSSWRDETRTDRRGALAAIVPTGLAERVVGVAAAAVLALGVIGVLGYRNTTDPTRAPELAAPAAVTSATTAAAGAPVRAAKPVKLTPVTPHHAGAAKPKAAAPKSASGDVARAAAAAAPVVQTAPAPAAAPASEPAPSEPTPAATADPGPSVAAGTTVAGEPVTAGASADGSGGVQVGPVVIGSPPPAGDTPGVTIDTGVLPAIQLGL